VGTRRYKVYFSDRIGVKNVVFDENENKMLISGISPRTEPTLVSLLHSLQNRFCFV